MIEVPASAPRVCKVFCEKENMAAAFAALAVASSPHPPRFDGMFLSLNSQTALWDTSMWKRDLEAMKTAQLRFFAVPHLARQIGPATAACPSGTFEAWFPSSSRLPTACFTQVGDTSSSAGTIGNILAAANATGLSVHLGLAKELRMDDQDKSVATLKAFADLQFAVAQQLAGGVHYWSDRCRGRDLHRGGGVERRAVAGLHAALRVDLLAGAHPQHQEDASRRPCRLGVALRSLQPHALSHPKVPAAVGVCRAVGGGARRVGARPRRRRAAGLEWRERELVCRRARAARQHEPRRRAQRRSAWSNVELFEEVWPRSCQWPDECHGRHPAPFSRIRRSSRTRRRSSPDPQVIAWEWTSCLSPTAGNGAAFPEANKANYEAYLAHIKELRNVYW